MVQHGVVIVGLGLALALAGAACEDDGGDGGSGGKGNGADGATGTSSGGEGGSGGQETGYCAKGCMAPADCCPPDQPDCSTDRYPFNFTCEEGLCGPPQCSTKEDCTATTMSPDYDCLNINGIRICARVCTEDANCTAPARCTGTSEDMKAYCKAENLSTGCMRDEDCSGFGRCEAGQCVCHKSEDCTSDYADTCIY
ncbi:hypothetical protein WME88_51635 [Sorangium sp. So ce216]